MHLKQKKIFCTLTLLFAAASAPGVALAGSGTADLRYEAVARGFIEKLLKAHPETATGLGDHRYDSRTSDYTTKGEQADRKLYHDTLAALEAIPAAELSPDDAVDSAILQNQLHASLFDIEVMHVSQREPLNYNPSQGIYLLLARDYAPLKERLEAVRARLLAFPAIVAAAKKNLKNPPRVFTETAIAQNKGAIALVREELDEYLKQEPSMRAKLAPARKVAAAALEDYGHWLENDLLPRSNGDFRIGAEHFREKLRYALDSDLTPEQILAGAESELRRTQQAMYETALPLYRSYFPGKPTDGVERKLIIRAVLDKIAEAHSDNSNIVPKAKQKLAEAGEFVRSHHLLTLPQDPIQVIVMPEFQRGVSVAYCDPSGPLEKNGATFYAISPTPADWTPERAASFFREYNDAMLNDLTVHEAMPGHYVQLAIANKVKKSTNVRDLFNSGTFVEGWATYAEQFMADEGFGGPETKMEQMKMRLRLIINSMLDQKIHAGSMTEQEAMKLMMDEGYQEEGEAAGKWRRALLTSTQLSTYFVGNMELNALARDMKAKTGDDWQAVHDRMLAHGSIATKYIRRLSGLGPMQ
ncbi:MAG TPA: DUF885 domain-containing protein [Burkholderiaceae bacterium]